MKKVKAILFYAPWDLNYKEKKDMFCEECRRLKLHYECMDVEHCVELTTKLGIRNVPVVMMTSGNDVIGIEKGNKAYMSIKKYLR